MARRPLSKAWVHSMNKCLNCKEEIESFNRNGVIKKFCSDECSYKYKYKAKNKLLGKRKCKNCNKEFEYFSKTNKKIYCSTKCCFEFLKKNKEKTSPFYKIRFQVFNRDNFQCIYCGRSSIEERVILEVEHLNPLKGKKPNWKTTKTEDLVTSCRECNVGKLDRILSVDVIKRIKSKINYSNELR